MKKIASLLLTIVLATAFTAGAFAQGHVFTKAAPSGPWWTTTSTSWVDIPGLDLWFYQYDQGNACINITAVTYVTAGKRLFVRAVVDGSPASPTDVVFASETQVYSRSFQFAATIDRGIHHVSLQASVDGGGTASFGDRTVSVITAPTIVNVIAAPSGPNITTTSGAWEDMPGMSLNLTLPAAGQLALTFCGEIVCDNGKRTFLRMLIDGAPTSPSDVVVASAYLLGVHSMTFVTPSVSSGNHVLKVQWMVDAGGTATLGDHTLTVALSDPTAIAAGEGGVASVSAVSGPWISTTTAGWLDIPGLALDITTPENATLVVSVQGEAYVSGGRLFARATVDGQACSPSDVVQTFESSYLGTSTTAFVQKNISGGPHRVAVQWHVDGGETGYFADRNLTVTVFPSDGPTLTGDFQAVTPVIGSNPLLVLLWDPHRPAHPAPTVGAMSNLAHGSYPSVADYFTAVSGDNFTITNAGILGWFNADKPDSFYWAPSDPTDADGDGFISGHTRKWWEAITKADPIFNFASFDTDGNGVLEPKELGIVIVIPQNSPFGTNRAPASREYPTWTPLVVDGVRIPVIAEVYAGSPPNLGVFVHELCHLLLGMPDMYFNFFFPFAAGQYSIMDVTYIDSHLDPFHKIRLGWLQPTTVTHSGQYSLYPSEVDGGAYVLMDPKHGDGEYYLVENRQRSFAYDTQLADSGMAVWHVIEDPAVYGSLSPPTGVSASDWNSVSAGDWGRRAIRMIRPAYGPPFNNSRALWDGADPATGYDLVSTDPTPGHGQLRWADGSPSGFAIRDISPATPVMDVTFELPGSATSVAEGSAVPSAFRLDQNYPNPFNPATLIRYHLPVLSTVRLTVIDILGRDVAILVNADQPPGTKEVRWDARGKSSGVYFCRLEATGKDGSRFVTVSRMILIR